MMIDALPPIIAYLLGSVSFAWLTGRLHGKDLREHGSGNLGATNAGRVLGGRWFVIVFCCDLIKGAAPVLAITHFIPPAQSQLGIPLLAVLTGLGAVLGHSFTCFHGFRGGKAVATSLGVCIGLVPLVAAIAAGIWLCAWLGFMVSLGLGKSGSVGPASVLASIATPVAHILLAEHPWGNLLPVTILLLLLNLLIIARHRSNIAALFKVNTR